MLPNISISELSLLVLGAVSHYWIAKRRYLALCVAYDLIEVVVQ